MATHQEIVETHDYELTVKIKFKGYESFRATDKEAAIRRMEEILDEGIEFKVPLCDMSYDYTIKAKKL